ncbi:bifunctional aminoglycoside phosphotransferase/ATP-binding protein [Arenibaculum pallidiluteum]|uniref:bifunctional aminoglycoside phosphotransferase/ATP-binding protein n=1 Tax=Arenibaculum pallidiluteum TaxID=2812559 RepID=UPI001A96565E|nr:AAA family ATPase [Arenibaculum pallidiluteum]
MQDSDDSASTRQDEVLDFLARPQTHGIAGPVGRIDTLISVVFLAGERAYKLKRAVRLPYLDFSTVELRWAACLEEVRLNARTAPTVYLGVVPVVRRPGGGLALGGEGEALDWLVQMRRFDQDALLDAVAGRGELDPRLARRLADGIAGFHEAQPPVAGYGGIRGMCALLDLNEARLAATGDGILDPETVRAVNAESRARLTALSETVERRRQEGRVRRLHGDLHLRNIVLIDGEPTLFDAIEFNPEIACCDVLYDLAFLLMDLVHRGLGGTACAIMNRYLDMTGDEDAHLLPFYMSVRAAIRAHVTAGAAGVAAPADRTQRVAEASAYLSLALDLLRPQQPVVLAIGGFSGTGKSTLAARLAPRFAPGPGARVLRTDVLRKRMAGVAPETRLPEALYHADRSEAVYAEAVRLACAAAAQGHPVIVDGVFATAAQRDAIEEAAHAASLAFAGLWLDGDGAVLKARIAARSSDASDADAAVLDRQLGLEPGPVRWERIAAYGPPQAVAAAAQRHLAALGLHLRDEADDDAAMERSRSR